MRLKPILTLAVAGALGACAGMGGGMDGDTVGDMTMEATIDAAPAMSNDRDLRGSARVRATSSNFGAGVSIAGAPSGGVHPWHVHRGTCGSGGPIVGNADNYPVLRISANGEASATAQIDAPLMAGDNYYVNIHASPTDLGTIIACGELN